MKELHLFNGLGSITNNTNRLINLEVHLHLLKKKILLLKKICLWNSLQKLSTCQSLRLQDTLKLKKKPFFFNHQRKKICVWLHENIIPIVLWPNHCSSWDIGLKLCSVLGKNIFFMARKQSYRKSMVLWAYGMA